MLVAIVAGDVENAAALFLGRAALFRRVLFRSRDFDSNSS
jgi:hypothetical protein